MGTLTCAAPAKLACVGGRIFRYTSLFTVILLTDAVSGHVNINLQRQRKRVSRGFHPEQVNEADKEPCRKISKWTMNDEALTMAA